jgi:hypothetical protein
MVQEPNRPIYFNGRQASIPSSISASVFVNPVLFNIVGAKWGDQV